MIDHITLGDISVAVGFIVALIGGMKYLHDSLKLLLTKMLEDQFTIVNTKLDDMSNRLDKVDMETTKNFIVRYLADLDRGEHITDVEHQRFWEEYEHYVQSGGNSYIKEWVERLKKEGKM